MPTLSDISNYIIQLISTVGDFLSQGVMFYIMCLVIFGMIIKYFLSFLRR